VEFAGREWQLLIEDPERPFPWATLGVGLSGLTVAAALIALLLGVRRRERLVEAEVAARMRERDDATAIAREREVRFAALGAHVPGGVLLTDAEGRCEYVNDRWAELAGISPGEALGEGWFEAVHPDDRVQVGEEWARAVRSQTEFELDYRLLAPDGTVRWVLGRATPFMDPASGEVSGFLGFVFDLTERLEAADALRESEERYRSVVEAAIDAIVVVDGDGRITSANDALVRIFGWPVHAVLDQPITMLVPDWTTDPTEGGHLVPGEAVETEGVRRDGSTFPLRIALESLALVGTTAQTAILQDLTDLKVAEALVADERDRLTAVIAAMQDGLVLLSPDGVGLVCNPRLCQILGVAEDDVIGSATPLRAATPEGRLRLRSLAAHAAAGVPGEVDAEFERPDGALISAIVSAAPIVDAAGEVVAVVETLKDATERKRLEEARDEFISVMSHELRTPLTSVHASLSMLEELAEDEQHEDAERRLLAIAQNNSERLMSLINDVLDLRRLSSGKEGLRYGTHRVAEMAHAAADPMAPLASQRGVAIRTDELPDDLELDCDRDKLVQVLTNYLSNAVKFSPPGGTVAVHAERVGSEVRISVADEGQGVRAEDRKRIFERFEMGDASDARRVGGTGLGLAISRSIADAHGGRVWVEPADGGGSCFVLAVPRHRPDRGEPAGAGPSLDYFSR
jgi:PAS domain S-box-containing protein